MVLRIYPQDQENHQNLTIYQPSQTSESGALFMQWLLSIARLKTLSSTPFLTYAYLVLQSFLPIYTDSCFGKKYFAITPLLHSHRWWGITALQQVCINWAFPLISMITPSCREVSEPSAAAMTEVEAESESSVAQQPLTGTEPEKDDGRLEEEVRLLRGWGFLGLCSVSL